MLPPGGKEAVYCQGQGVPGCSFTHSDEAALNRTRMVYNIKAYSQVTVKIEPLKVENPPF